MPPAPVLAPAAGSAWPNVPGWLPLTEAAVRRIAALEDASVRNLWITLSYADLARRMLVQLETDQTWCTFAIWASNTAGASIRGEELPGFASRVLFGTALDPAEIAAEIDAHALPWRRRRAARLVERTHIEHFAAQAVTRVARHIGHGNVIVYAELAPLFVRLLERVEQGGRPSRADVSAVLGSMELPNAADAPLVCEAFHHYTMAMATEGDERAQHVLAANIAAVLHEQERLQPDIAGALDAAPADLGVDLITVSSRFLPRWLEQAATRLVHRRVAPHLAHVWDTVATHLLMTLEVPDEVLHLGRDVPPLPGGGMFPPALRHVTLAALAELLASWDPTDGTGRNSGAADWEDLHQRMGYIVNLFRSRQRCLELTAPPFPNDWLAAMLDGRLPAGC